MEEKAKIRSHKDLVVWQKSVELSLQIYRITERFPGRETYALSSQLRRAAVSIPSNIAEGRGRHTRKDFSHFLRIAFGSASELETQLVIAHRLEFLTSKAYEETNALLAEVSKMLRAMIEKLGASS